MKRHWLNLLMVVLLWSSLLAPAKAQPGAATSPLTFIFDEVGSGSIDLFDGSGFLPLPGALAADPSNGGALALTYLLPVTVGCGDVLAYEDTLGGTLSDAIRFTTPGGDLTGGGADRLIFYSDLPEPGESAPPADTGFPDNLGAGASVSILEVGPEIGPNGFTYITSGPATYIGISDPAVPEPGSLALLVSSGLTGSFFAFRRLRKR